MSINDSTNLIIPSGILKAFATLPAATPEKPDGYTIDFGKFENGAMKLSGELKESWLPLASGGLGLAALRRMKGAVTFEFDLKHFNKTMLQYAFGSTAGQAPQPGKVVDLFFYLAMISLGEGIDGTTGKAPIVYHSFQGALTLDGDMNANGSDYGNLKLRVSPYLAIAPGVWDTSRT